MAGHGVVDRDYGNTVTVSAEAVKRLISITGGTIQPMVWVLTVRGDPGTSETFTSAPAPTPSEPGDLPAI